MAVPGSNPRFIEKAATSPADILLFDLEDAVAPDEKERARRTVIAALNDIDWGSRTLSVRINGLDTPYMYRDVIDIAEQAGDRLDLMMIPKVGTGVDVASIDVLLTQVEMAMRRTRPIGLELLIETALGLENIGTIAAASTRTESLHFGSGDFAASTGARTTSIGGSHPAYHVLTDPDVSGERHAHWNDLWHFAQARLVVAARAHGLRPVDGPFADFRDEAGLRAAAGRAAVLGCDGKWAIHPAQIDVLNEIFTPGAADVERARRILAAMAQATAEGTGAVALDGRMIDVASIRQAEVIVAKAESIAASGR
jgi:malyl-CoA/(S)-citramalyl-CoA lyase